MLHVYTPKRISTQGYHSKKDILKKMRPSVPRDDLRD